MTRKNLRSKNPDKVSCEHQPPWYNQLIRMDEKTRLKAAESALEKIKKAKPDTYEFLKKFDMELVGFMPNVAYTMPDDSEDALNVTYVHDFSQSTLLYWCKKGGFGIFVNASLDYNAKGLRGFIY
jgi:hypothetical protein